MNAPNFSFDPDRLPSVVGSGSLPARESPRALMKLGEDNMGEGEPVSDYRKLFFTYLGLALKYRWLILGTCCVALAIGFIVTITATPIYRATTTIQIDREAPKVVKVGNAGNEHGWIGDTLRFYQTQYDLLKSRSLAERVAGNLDLSAASDFIHPKSTSPWAKLVSMIFPHSETAGKNQANFAQKKAIAASIVQGGLSRRAGAELQSGQNILQQPERAMGPAHRRRRCG